MKTNELVVLRGSKALTIGSDKLYPNKYYRCLKVDENNRNEYIVYGICFSEKDFNDTFEYAYDKVKRDWVANGLIENDKPLSFNKFKNKLDVHTYGRGRNVFHIGFIRFEDLLYGFYPIFKDNKLNSLKTFYTNYLKFFDGNLCSFDSEWIQCGNKGIPIGGGDLGSWY